LLFFIRVTHRGKSYRLKVNRIHTDEVKERFIITARNGTYTAENNRPVLMARNLKNKRITWIMIDAGNMPGKFRDDIFNAIEAAVHKAGTAKVIKIHPHDGGDPRRGA
jgi:hypothetical protein